MAGLYIHIPFCAKKCAYCAFFSQAHVGQMEAFVDALLAEIHLRRDELTSPIETLYLGGGTPSLLPVAQWERVFAALEKEFSLSSCQEITLEGNPESLTAHYLRELRRYTPVQRLSIGVQSFHQKDLHYLGRAHRPEEAALAIENAQKTGFSQLSVDLIYGMPTLTDDDLQVNLNRLLDYGVTHISAYALTVEDKTLLQRRIREDRCTAPDEEQTERQFLLLHQWLHNAGYQGYETSNFCKEGAFAKHNINYWRAIPYLGLGPSAHSFSGEHRRWNVAKLTEYINGVSNGKTVYEEENLTETMKYNEYVMTAIRTSWGVSRTYLREHFTPPFVDHYDKESALIPAQWIQEEDLPDLKTSLQGKLFADQIACRLFR